MPRKNMRRLVVGVVLVVLFVAACAADPPCALGVRGWCENEMAALAIRTVVIREASPQAEIIVVEEGFALDAKRYGGATVRGLKREQLDADMASPSRGMERTTIVISDVRVLNAAGYGMEQAQGSATVTIYQGSKVVRSETVRGKLVNGAWVLGER
jgi:hypothetical protein